MKKRIKSGLIFIIIGACITLPYYIWHSFWCLGIGVLVILGSLVSILYSFFNNNDVKRFYNIGITIAIIFTIVCFFWHEERYITNNGTKQHLFQDCSTLSNSKIKMVTEAEGFFNFAFTDCKICKRQRDQIKIQNGIERKERERIKLRSYLQDLLNRLDDGEDPNIIKEELINDWSRTEDDNDYIFGIPSRFQ